MENTNLKKQLEILGVESIGFLTKILAENDKRATGNLIKSLDFKIIKGIDGLMLQILAADYFKYVDAGRRPGKQPPIKSILSWIKNKPIGFKNMTDNQAAFIIARSIGKKGIKPLHAMDKLVNNILTKKDELLKLAAIKDIEEFIQTTFKV
jgi:hypothetical protein